MHSLLAAAAFLCLTPRAIDGDTLFCTPDLHVRLVAIDAREMNGRCRHPDACATASPVAARDALQQLVDGATVRCSQVGSSYTRVVARCIAIRGEHARDLSCAMVQNGKAAEWRKFGRACDAE